MPSHHRYCCVCKNFGGKVVDGKRISMHRFPTELSSRRIWIQRCKNARPNFRFVNSDQTRICGIHFIGRSGPTKLDPLPTYFPKADGSEKEYKISKSESSSTVCTSISEIDPLRRDISVAEDDESDCTSCGDHPTVTVKMTQNDSTLDLSLKLHDYHGTVPTAPRMRHKSEEAKPSMVTVATQTYETRIPQSRHTQTAVIETMSSSCQVTRPGLTFEDIEASGNKVLFYTGLPNAGTFKCLFEELSGGMESEGKGRPKAMRLIDEFFMVLMRLRLGLVIEDLAGRFNISIGTCSTVFNRWVNYLNSNLNFLIQWPSRKNVNDTMPRRFSTKYPNCRVIIDCTEIRTETPSSLQLKSLLYSNYKSHMTWKSLVGISPAGIVTFVSDLYPGSISDKQITKKSGLVDLCEEGDSIMVDKGFLISDLTTPRGIDLIIPPFKKKRQFTPREVQRTKDIANLRIHVERQMERIKNFRILQGTMPITMASQATKIWQICVCLTNLLPPLVPKN